MKAIVMTATGSPDVLKLAEIDEPRISLENQIKIQLKAAGINPVDTKLRRNGVFYGNKLPAVLGCDGAGVVMEIGSAVTRFKPGDQVWFCHGGLGDEPGTYAQFNVMDERWATPMPKSLNFEIAASGPLVLITAWGALYDRARLQSGQTVLIHGGTGGVGHVAIQLAKLRGAIVYTTAGSAEKAQLAKQWGADFVIDYSKEDFVEAVNRMTNGKGVDVVLESIGVDILERSTHCTAHFGDIVTLLDTGTASLAEARMRNLRIGFELMLTPMLRNLDAARAHHVEILNQCARWIDEGALRLHLGQTFPLESAAEAHALLETGHMAGKAVLRIG